MSGITSRPMDAGIEARQQEWVHRAAKGGQLRVREDAGTGEAVIYNAKRNFFGSAVSAIKDIGASEARAMTRSRAATDFQAFLYDRFGTAAAKHITQSIGLGGRELRARDVDAAIALGERLETVGSPELGRTLNVDRLPRDVRAGMKENNGFATPELIQTLLTDESSRNLGLESDDIDVRQRTANGAATQALFTVKVGDGDAQSFIVKEAKLGFEYEVLPDDPDGLPPGKMLAVTAQMKGPDGVIRNVYDENRHLEALMRSPVGRFEPIQLEGGMTLALAMPVRTVSYVAEGRVSLDGAVSTERVEHQLAVLKRAQGEALSDVLNREPELAADRMRQVGQAIAAFHRQNMVGDPSADQGFNTVVHGDFLTSNVFFDSETNTLTLIDLAEMGKSVAQEDGTSMLMDIKRMLGTSLAGQEDLQQAFLEGYCAQLADLREAGAPLYTPESIRDLLRTVQVDAALV